jgi:hypothetical protein
VYPFIYSSSIAIEREKPTQTHTKERLPGALDPVSPTTPTVIPDIHKNLRTYVLHAHHVENDGKRFASADLLGVDDTDIYAG